MRHDSHRPFVAAALLAAGLLASGCAAVHQGADPSFRPRIDDPAYAPGNGPVVLIDEAHSNYHTADGRYRPFAELLRSDGYVVRAATTRVTAELLRDADVLVIANSLAAVNRKRWRLPNPSAFARDEITAIRDWVERGGALLLIADHMPFPGAAAELAAAFGVLFGNGFAVDETGSGLFTFRRDDGTLADHPITRGRNASERVDSVRTFTGQAFRAVADVDPLLVLPAGTTLLLPVRAWKFSSRTPRVPAEGLLQAATLRFGSGRVAVFGEAALFSAQLQVHRDRTKRMGMNAPDATENARFLLNTLHWLSRDP